MIELFRYIEHAFVDPISKEKVIDAEGQSDFQDKLRSFAQQDEGSDRIKKEANKFIEKHFSNLADNPFILKQQYLDFHIQLLKMKTADDDSIKSIFRNIFNTSAVKLIATDSFIQDKQLLSDSIIAVKLVTAFDIVNSTELVSMRQSIFFIDQLASGNLTINSSEDIRNILLRPIRIPNTFLKPGNTTNQQEQPIPTSPSEESKRREHLLKEYGDLKATYETLMALRPDELKMVELKQQKNNIYFSHKSALENEKIPLSSSTSPLSSSLTLSTETVDRLSEQVNQTLHRVGINLFTTPLTTIVETIKKKWVAISKQAVRYQIPKRAKIFQLGIHTFAVQDLRIANDLKDDAPETGSVSDSDPDPAMDSVTFPGAAFDFSAADLRGFKYAITKPVGFGNLQIVRQELLGYEVGEISHVENVMESELFRRSNRRSETNELTTIQESITTKMEERDLQSTEHNELVKETQKESGKSSVHDNTSTTEYGKLVDNNKTAYARTVTDRAVSSLTQQIRSQRIDREKKSYVERTVHEFDNRQAGSKKICGIYQWIDKKYRNRIMNYGKRLLYDVVLPEPSAFLIETLKNSMRPESFQLTKPTDPSFLSPSDLDAGNYMFWAKEYGVTGTVTPPPDEFITVTHPESQDVGKEIKSYGVNWDLNLFLSFDIPIENNYKAISGYIQMVNWIGASVEEDRAFEFYIGEYLWFDHRTSSSLNTSFGMNGETGKVPVTFRTFAKVVQFSFAIGITCQRSDKVYEQWQLKTYAAIMEGYRRQYSEYQDQLAKLQASTRTQMARSQNYAHNPSIEREELKKAFIFLIISEHYWSGAFVGSPTPSMYPAIVPPDPAYYKKWGAMVAFFERAFEWENIMYTYYPYFWGRNARWGELILIQDINPQFEQFLKAGAARVVVPVRPGYEAAMAHYHETGDIWMGKQMPDMFSDLYVSIIEEIKARNYKPEDEVCVEQWDIKLPTTLVMLKADETLPAWDPTPCNPVI